MVQFAIYGLSIVPHTIVLSLLENLVSHLEICHDTKVGVVSCSSRRKVVTSGCQGAAVEDKKNSLLD